MVGLRCESGTVTSTHAEGVLSKRIFESERGQTEEENQPLYLYSFRS